MSVLDDTVRRTIAEQRDEITTLRAGNAKLRDRYDAYEYKMDGLVSMLTGGLLSKSAATPNSVIYSVAQEEMTDELEEENTKLRELVTDLALDYLYSCGYHTQRHDGFPRHTCAEYEGLLDEIGIEVENV
jgi:hypothetical protein